MCPGEAPVLGGAGGSIACWDGFWAINSTLTLVATHFNIEGRIHIAGNFTLPAGSSLSWRGFQKQNDSHPEFSVGLGDFILSHVNVTDDVVIQGDIYVNITAENLVGIVGAVDSTNLTRTSKQPIFESSNQCSVSLLVPTNAMPSCRRITVSTESSTASSGRSSLSAVFSIDDSACMSTPSKMRNNRKIVEIVAPTVIVGAFVIIAVLVLLTLKTDCFKQLVRPFSKRKAIQQRESMILASMSKANDVQNGDGSSKDDSLSYNERDLEAGNSTTSHVMHPANSTALLGRDAPDDEMGRIEDEEDRRSDIVPDSDCVEASKHRRASSSRTESASNFLPI